MQRSLCKERITAGILLLILFAEMCLLGWLVFRETLLAIYPYPHREWIKSISAETGVPEQVILATIKVESNFDETAVSNRGAIGLMQVMPETFNWVAQRFGIPISNAYNVADNVYAGAAYLAYLYDKYHDWDLVHAAYNAGDGAVDRWLADPRYGSGGKLHTIPYEETAQYLKKIKRAKHMYQILYFYKKGEKT